MDYYIVRIYRHEKKRPHDFVGIVEEVDPRRGRKEKKAFTNVDELWEILNATGGLLKQKMKNEGSRRTGETGKG